MNNVLVTVGIPVRNAEKSISTALESIINQDYAHKNIELIVVNDGCTDNTIPVVREKMKNSDIVTRTYSTGGKGLGIARQTIVDNSKGKYLVSLDADMWMSKEYISVIVEHMEQDPKIGKARGILSNKATGKLLGDLQFWAYGSQVQQKTESKIAGIGGSICRTDAIKQVGGFDLQIHGAGEDVDLAIRMLDRGWKFSTFDALFYNSPKTSARSLIKKEIWYGYGGHYLGHKHRRSFGLTLIPPVAFIIGVRKSVISFKFWHNKRVFFLPIMFFFSSFGWWTGFTLAHFRKYQPKKIV